MHLLLCLDGGGGGVSLPLSRVVHLVIFGAWFALLLLLTSCLGCFMGIPGPLAEVVFLPLLLLDLLHGPGVVGLLGLEVEPSLELLLRGGGGVKLVLERGSDLGGLPLGLLTLAGAKDKVVDILTIFIFVDYIGVLRRNL